MRKIRRSVMIVVSLIIVILLYFLPSFFCLHPVVRSTLALINQQIPGTTEVQSCSLGWWQGLSCEGFGYQNPALGIRVNAPKLAGSKGLFVLLLAPRYLGEITLDQPTLTVLPRPVEGEKGMQNGTAAARAPWWERLTFGFKVNRGLVVLAQGQDRSRELAREVDLQGSLVVGTFNYTLALRSGMEHQGHLRAEGFINLPTARQSMLEMLISRTEVEIKGMEIAAFLDLAASRGNFPKGKGVLDATYHVATAGLDDLEIQGETRLRQMQLSGGFLGQDQPAVDHLMFKFKGSHKGKEGWRLATLNLESNPLRIEANGSYDRTKASFAAKGSVRLPEVAAQLPQLLSLHQKTVFKEGLVEFGLNVSGTPQEIDLKADCRTGRLAVVHNGRPYSWDTPLSLVAEAERRHGKTKVRTLLARTPFLEARGKGGADDFALRATADLGRMFEELEKIFALNFSGKGKMELTGSSQQGQDGRYRFDTRVGINNFALARGGIPVFLHHDFLLTGEAWAPPSFFQHPSLASLRLDTRFWPGKFSLVAQNGGQEGGEKQTACTLQGMLDLQRLNSFFHGLVGFTPPCKLAGNLTFDASGLWRKNRLSLETLAGTIEQLAVTGQGYAHQEPRVMVSLANSGLTGINHLGVRELQVTDNWQEFIAQERPALFLDFQQQRLDLRHLTVEAAGTAARSSLSLANWRQPRRDFTAEINGTSSAALLAVFLKAAGWFPEELTLKGRAQTSFKARASSEQKVLTELAVRLEPFELLRARKRVFRDSRVLFKTTMLSGGEEDSQVLIPAFVLQSTPLNAEGTGLVQQDGVASLELQGKLTPDLSFFSSLLAAGTGQKVALTGKREGVFLFACPLRWPIAWNQMTLAANVPVESLRYQGVELHQLDMPVEARQGKLRVNIAGPFNGGMMAMQPHWDFVGPRPVVTLPSASQILRDVSLTQPLLDGLMGSMHPLFGALTQPEGPVDLRLDTFSWSPDPQGGQWPVFKATFGLSKVRLTPTGVLQELLELGGFDQKTWQCKERQLTCEGRAGRITCAPLYLVSDTAEFGISGSVGMDRTLDVRIQMPVTGPLVDRVHLSLPPEGSVTATITGVLDSPAFDPKGFLAMVSNQLSKAAAEKPSEPKGEPIPDRSVGAGAEPPASPSP